MCFLPDLQVVHGRVPEHGGQGLCSRGHAAQDVGTALAYMQQMCRGIYFAKYYG